MDEKIKISVEPREGLTHSIKLGEDRVLHEGDVLVVTLGRDGEVASLTVKSKDKKEAK